MAYGLIIKNSSNYIQIDQDHPNYTLIASGTISIRASAIGSVNPAKVSFPSQESPIVVCIGATGSAFVTLGARTPTTIDFVASASVSLPYRIYATTSDNPGVMTGYGFIVKNASGGVVFNGNNAYMRVGQVVFSTVGYSTMPTVNHSFGNAFVDATNLGSRMSFRRADTITDFAYATSLGMQVGNGFYKYGAVVTWTAQGIIGPGDYNATVEIEQAMVLSA